jgi:methyl-accepting chemotaxis protein
VDKDGSKLTRRIIFATLFSIVITISIYGIFLPIILNFNFEKSMEFWKSLALNILLLSPLATLIIYWLYLPISRLIKRINNDEKPDEISLKKAVKALDFIPNFLFFMGAISYTLGVLLHYAQGMISKNYMTNEILISRLIIALIWGMLNGFVTARILNIFLIQSRIRLKIYHLKATNIKTKENILTRLFFPLIILFLFAISSSLVTYYHHNKEILEKTDVIVSDLIKKVKSNEVKIENADKTENEIKQELSSNNYNNTIFNIILGTMILGYLSILVFIILLETRSYIKNLSSQIQNLTEGKMDLTKRINITSFDDIGGMTDGINLIIDNLSGTFREIKRVTTNVYDSSTFMQKTIDDSQNSAYSLDNILAEFERNLKSQVDEIKVTVEIFNKILPTIESSIAKINGLASTVDSTSSSIRSTIDSFETLIKSTLKADGLFNELSDSIVKSNDFIFDSIEAIREINETSVKVSEIVEIISSIASQTNLLAMNAAIEAAHAKDFGKGFAVVADEIRKLSENTSESTNDITSLIAEMNTKIINGSKIFEAMQGLFSVMNDKMKNTGELITEIANHSKDQEKNTINNLNQIGSLLDQTNGLKQNTESQKEDLTSLEKLIRSLNNISEKITKESSDLSNGIKFIIESFNNIKNNSMKTFDNIREMETKISQFKIE